MALGTKLVAAKAAAPKRMAAQPQQAGGSGEEKHEGGSGEGEAEAVENSASASVMAEALIEALSTLRLCGAWRAGLGDEERWGVGVSPLVIIALLSLCHAFLVSLSISKHRGCESPYCVCVCV